MYIYRNISSIILAIIITTFIFTFSISLNPVYSIIIDTDGDRVGNACDTTESVCLLPMEQYNLIDNNMDNKKKSKEQTEMI